MTRRKATYYIRIDTYWQNSPNRWVGPFDSRADAEAEIERATSAPDSLAVTFGQTAADIWRGIRIHEVLSSSDAWRRGMRDWAFGDERSNVIGTRIPTTTDELFDMELRDHPEIDLS